MARISAEIYAECAIPALQYGVTDGYSPLRDAINARQKQRFNIGASKANGDAFDDVTVIVSGGQQGIELACKVFCNEGDAVICEEPTFIGALNAFRSNGAVPVGVTLEDDGMNIAELEEKIKSTPNAKLIYTIPTFHNPCGITTSYEKRIKIYELSHFLIKEILTRTVCEILDCTKNRHVESVVTYILTYSVFNNLIDEYAAHSVEGRFTIFGYQDYSSFIALQSDLDPEHIDIAKTIGNTFSIYIKDMLEGFIDWDLREEIKDQFLADTIEKPNYAQLGFESCNRLNDEGFMKAIWLILSEGFQNADAEVIESYEQQFTKK